MQRAGSIVVALAGLVLLLPPVGTAAAGDPAQDPPSMPSAGCGTPAAADVAERGSLLLDGVERSWQAHVPPAYDGVTPVPLVILLHGLGEDSGIIRNLTTSGLPDDAGFLVVAPQGSGLIARWMWDLDDFISALLDELEATTCLDEARIYAAGYSNGAIGVSALGCVLEGRLAAIGAVEGLTDFGAACQLDRPLPTLGIQAADDPYVLIEGGWGEGIDAFMLEDFVTYADQPITSWPGFQRSFDERLRAIAARNGCGAEPVVEPISDDAERQAWPCPRGAAVELIVTHGSGHAWPSSVIDAGTELWAFFSRQALGQVGGA